MTERTLTQSDLDALGAALDGFNDAVLKGLDREAATQSHRMAWAIASILDGVPIYDSFGEPGSTAESEKSRTVTARDQATEAATRADEYEHQREITRRYPWVKSQVTQ